ncbi:ABC transporter permease [Solicola sp. PLA-1-18]|uniref:ABC transporter permease n=1 Tax=Solicola sp. PLA-1-18 TaxID=3380532 RepID=UPI003B7DE29F
MRDALVYEWFRVTTIRSTYWLVGVTWAFTLVVSGIVAWQLPEFGPLAGGREPLSLLVTFGASTGIPPLFTAYIVGIVGVFAMGHEYRHGMVRATLTSVHGRLRVLLAKLLVVALVAVLTTVGCAVISVVVGLSFGVDLPIDGFLFGLLLALVIYTVLFSWAGVAFAAIVRNQTAAVAMLVLIPTLAEQIIRAVVLAIKAASGDPQGQGGITVILKFLPFDAGGQMYTRTSINQLFEFLGYRPFGPVGGGIVFTVFVALLLTLAGWLFVRRDA